MQSWSFFTQHITRGKTIASEEFSTQSQASGTPSEVEEEDLSSAGGDLTGIQPPKSRTQRRSSTATVSTQPSHSVSSASEEIRSQVKQILSQANVMSGSSRLQGQEKIVHDFGCLTTGYMMDIPVDRWHSYTIEALTLLEKYRRPSMAQPPQSSYPPPSQSLYPPPPQSLSWQPQPQPPQPWTTLSQQFWPQQQQPHTSPTSATAWQPLQSSSPRWQPSTSLQAPSQPSTSWHLGQASKSLADTNPVQSLPSATKTATTTTTAATSSPSSPQLLSPPSFTPLALTPGSADSSLQGLSPFAKDLDAPLMTPRNPDDPSQC